MMKKILILLLVLVLSACSASAEYKDHEIIGKYYYNGDFYSFLEDGTIVKNEHNQGDFSFTINERHLKMNEGEEVFLSGDYSHTQMGLKRVLVVRESDTDTDHQHDGEKCYTYEILVQVESFDEKKEKEALILEIEEFKKALDMEMVKRVVENSSIGAKCC